jgi:hypothetical protein
VKLQPLGWHKHNWFGLGIFSGYHSVRYDKQMRLCAESIHIVLALGWWEYVIRVVRRGDD